jgi:hypothetical protein
VAEPLTPQQMREALELLQMHGGITAASRASGIHRNTLSNRIERGRMAIAKGQLEWDGPIPGLTVKSVTTDENEEGIVTRRHIKQVKANEQAEDPEGLAIKGLSQYVDGQGNLIGEWRKWDKERIDPVETAKQIAEAFDGMKVKKPRIDVPRHNTEDQLALYPVSDWHLGLMTWGKETVEDWDLDISVKAIRDTMSEVVARTQTADTAILLSVGDLIHSDNNRNMTAKSGNILDVDGRYQKIIHATCALMADVAMMALQKHKKVIIRVLPGNHDEHSCIAVTYFLSAFFKDNKRVEVDLDPSPFFVYPFGDNLIVSTHGHTIKPEKLQTFVSSNYRDLWGKAKHVHGFVGHLHHVKRIADEVSGMVIEQLPAPIPPDAWHFGAGYISGRAIASFSFHATDGLVSRLNQTMRTGE